MKQGFNGSETQVIRIEGDGEPKPGALNHDETIEINPFAGIKPEEADTIYTYVYRYNLNLRLKLQTKRAQYPNETMTERHHILKELWDEYKAHEDTIELALLKEVLLDVVNKKTLNLI